MTTQACIGESIPKSQARIKDLQGTPLSKNAKRKLERYGRIPTGLDIPARFFDAQVKDVKKLIYKKLMSS